MGRLTPVALVGAALGYGLWWLVGLMPGIDVSAYLWFFVGGGGLAALVLVSAGESGVKETLFPFLGWGVVLCGIMAVSWVGTWGRRLFPDIPDWAWVVGGIVVIFAGFYALDGVKSRREKRKLQHRIAEGKARTQERRARRNGVPDEDLRREPEPREQP